MDSSIGRGLVLGGGGELGYVEVKWLKKFISTFNITIPLSELFGVIAGTSVGAINGVSVAYQKSLDDLEKLYAEKGKRIFTSRTLLERTPPASHNASTDSLMLTDAQKIASIIANEAFYGSPYTDSDYGHNVLHNTLIENFGADTTLKALKTNVIVPAYNFTKDTAVKFSNYSHLEYFLPDAKIVDVLRATSAAPVYFPQYKIGDDFYEDGGIHLNLPIEQCLTALKIIKKTSKIRILVLSTGAAKELIQAQGSIKPEMSDIEKKEINAEYAISKIFRLYTTSSALAQAEAIKNLELLCRYTLDDIAGYCFHPLLDTPLTFTVGEGSNKQEYIDYKPSVITMDNTNQIFLAYLDALVEKDFRDNSDKIATFASKLLA